MQGLRCIKIPEMGEWRTYNGFRPIPGWCDFMLIDESGRTAFVDAKTTEERAFSFSMVNQDQIKFMEAVGDLCPAGYVVYFRGSLQKVVYYPWWLLKALIRGSSLHPVEGMDLGQLTSLSVKKIFVAPITKPSP